MNKNKRPRSSTDDVEFAVRVTKGHPLHGVLSAIQKYHRGRFVMHLATMGYAVQQAGTPPAAGAPQTSAVARPQPKPEVEPPTASTASPAQTLAPSEPNAYEIPDDAHAAIAAAFNAGELNL